jgi:hypothetical protein
MSTTLDIANECARSFCDRNGIGEVRDELIRAMLLALHTALDTQQAIHAQVITDYEVRLKAAQEWGERLKAEKDMTDTRWQNLLSGLGTDKKYYCEVLHDLRAQLAATTKEQDELRAAYTCCMELIMAYRMTKDVEIDWKKFPSETLCAAHVEIVELRAKLVAATKERDEAYSTIEEQCKDITAATARAETAERERDELNQIANQCADNDLKKMALIDNLRTLTSCPDGVDLASHVGELVKDRERLRAIRELMGNVEDGSNETVNLYQDDATKTFFIHVGRDEWFSSSLGRAIDAAKGKK